jgi:hypothetical protein
LVLVARFSVLVLLSCSSNFGTISCSVDSQIFISIHAVYNHNKKQQCSGPEINTSAEKKNPIEIPAHTLSEWPDNKLQQSVNPIRRARQGQITGIARIKINYDVYAKMGCRDTFPVNVDSLSVSLGMSTWPYKIH